MAPDYDHLTLMQKVEVFEHALETTNGDDLAKLLWLKSPSSEVAKLPSCGVITHYNHCFKMLRFFKIWFDRRTNYTRSLAVMSMVGYILGLGDRSNLMIIVLDNDLLREKFFLLIYTFFPIAGILLI